MLTKHFDGHPQFFTSPNGGNRLLEDCVMRCDGRVIDPQWQAKVFQPIVYSANQMQQSTHTTTQDLLYPSSLLAIYMHRKRTSAKVLPSPRSSSFPGKSKSRSNRKMLVPRQLFHTGQWLLPPNVKTCSPFA